MIFVYSAFAAAFVAFGIVWYCVYRLPKLKKKKEENVPLP